MSGKDIRNKAEELKGAAKEKFGDATDNERLQAEGATEKAKANAKQTLEHAKDNLEDATDAAADKVKSTFDR